MFKKKIQEEIKIPVSKIVGTSVTDSNLCAGCGKSVNVPTAQNEKGIYHSTECFNKVNPAQ